MKAGAFFVSVGPPAERRAPMLKLLPPIWALFYLTVAAAISYVAGWPRVPGLPAARLRILLIVLAGALAITTARLFRREGTEINPTSPANPKLITSGPYGFTRNQTYLGLTIISLGVAFWVGWWPMFLAPIVTFATASWAHIPFDGQRFPRRRESVELTVRPRILIPTIVQARTTPPADPTKTLAHETAGARADCPSFDWRGAKTPDECSSSDDDAYDGSAQGAARDSEGQCSTPVRDPQRQRAASRQKLRLSI